MPRRKKDSQGIAPEQSQMALLLIDVINDFEFDGEEKLAHAAIRIADNIAAPKRRAKAVGIPIIYVNDNFGKWQSNVRKLVVHCTNNDVRGAELVKQLLPQADDYFILKPKQSGFYATALELLLRYLKAHVLILCGLTADNCVLITAVDVDFIGINPIKALFSTAVINGMLSPPLLVIIMLVSSNRKVMGNKVNGRGANILGWIAAVVMFAAAIGMILTMEPTIGS